MSGEEECKEYFTLKFCESIVTLFLECKEITRRNNLNLLHKRGDNAYDLEDFLSKNLIIESPYYESEEENNIDNNIDEL